MRLLVACSNCSHQYDATGHPLGTRFRCACGNTLTVKEPDAHDAAVVRCSSCGGPRGSGTNCEFCGSAFTLHERDLNTICPACMTRISDKARFCHSCGQVIADANSAGTEAADTDCPACEEKVRLFSREIGQERLAILECPRCAGIWVGESTFRMLERRAKERNIVDTTTSSAPKVARPEDLARPQGASIYRPCVVCGALMNRQNYGRRSGVIVDRCRDHGIWFDNEELGLILNWIHDGGLEHAQRRNRMMEEEEAYARRQRTGALSDSVTSSQTGSWSGGSGWSGDSSWGSGESWGSKTGGGVVVDVAAALLKALL